MRNLAIVLGLGLSLVACEKKGAFGGGDKSDDPAAAKPVADDKPGADSTKPEPVAKAEAPKPAPEKPKQKTGILDLELQEVEGGWKLYSPRISMFFTSKPQVQRQDAPTPDGTQIPGAVAQVESGNQFSGLIYIPIPKDVAYDVKGGLKGARDGMMNMFEGHYEAKDEKTKLGPFDANHVSADGMRSGQNFHVEAWIAWDDQARTVYGLMAVTMQGDTGGIASLPKGFTLREDAAPAEVDAANSKGLKDLVKKKAPAPARAPKAPPSDKQDPYGI